MSFCMNCSVAMTAHATIDSESIREIPRVSPKRWPRAIRTSRPASKLSGSHCQRRTHDQHSTGPIGTRWGGDHLKDHRARVFAVGTLFGTGGGMHSPFWLPTVIGVDQPDHDDDKRQ
jgi:hypothetical protein